eukprot:scaffold219725_cov41-Tisochrysis_lutea.AAC.1
MRHPAGEPVYLAVLGQTYEWCRWLGILKCGRPFVWLMAVTEPVADVTVVLAGDRFLHAMKRLLHIVWDRTRPIHRRQPVANLLGELVRYKLRKFDRRRVRPTQQQAAEHGHPFHRADTDAPGCQGSKSGTVRTCPALSSLYSYERREEKRDGDSGEYMNNGVNKESLARRGGGNSC